MKRTAETRERYNQRRREYREENRERLRREGREYYARNRKRVIETAARYFVRKKYGVTAEQYAELGVACDGRCGVCQQVPAGRFSKLCVDHDHDTGQVRGMLCHGCNTALGMLKEDPVRIRALAVYIETRTTK